MGTIIKYTIKEMFYKKIFSVTIFLAAAFLALYATSLYFTYKDITDDLLMRATISTQLLGAGFYFTTFIVVFLTILGSVGLFSTELESGLLYPILSKPITRTKFLLGKFLGLALCLTLFSIFMILGVICLNLYFAKDIALNVTLWNLIKATGIYVLIPINLLAFIFFFSIRLKSLATGIIVVLIYMVGVIGGMIEQAGSIMNKEILLNIGIISSLISPVDSLYRKFMSLLYENSFLSNLSIGPFGASGEPPSIYMIAYTILFSLSFLYLANSKFNKLDL